MALYNGTAIAHAPLRTLTHTHTHTHTAIVHAPAARDKTIAMLENGSGGEGDWGVGGVGGGKTSSVPAPGGQGLNTGKKEGGEVVEGLLVDGKRSEESRHQMNKSLWVSSVCRVCVKRVSSVCQACVKCVSRATSFHKRTHQ